mmetsp:Transcript_4762/g.17114  ORF Transcript_4762/g.17114 Transcript_4762/m.17114 type:complete len:660 (+) Transcript_4762:84-2063(+)
MQRRASMSYLCSTYSTLRPLAAASPAGCCAANARFTRLLSQQQSANKSLLASRLGQRGVAARAVCRASDGDGHCEAVQAGPARLISASRYTSVRALPAAKGLDAGHSGSFAACGCMLCAPLLPLVNSLGSKRSPGAAHAATVEGAPSESSAAAGASQLRLFNTLRRQKELFVPMEEGKVKLYVCGVTVYDYSHIGHARVYVAFDILYRLLKTLGYDVTYCRNFTDVDDKIIKRANEGGSESPLELSARFIKEFHIDMEALQCESPTFEPKVSEHIEDIIEMISRIIDHGHAYVLDNGDVFFEVPSLESYGELSGRKPEDNEAGERVAIDNRKRNPADFALWKSAKPEEGLQWDSPWGPGRPGWHIECSAMINKILGPNVDIHGGGLDLVFPHHENELAQSKAANQGSGFVNYWMHNGFVNVASEKMSKSLGNFFTIREVLKEYHPLTLRFFLLGTQYRSPINYSSATLNMAADRSYYLYQTMADLAEGIRVEEEKSAGQEVMPMSPVAKEAAQAVDSLYDDCLDALQDDLNTTQVIALLSDPLKAANDLMSTKKGRKAKGRLQAMNLIHESIADILSLLGLHSADVPSTLLEMQSLALHRAGMTVEDLEQKMAEREEARAAKDYAKSDSIREELASKGVLLMDTGAGMGWRPGSPDTTS